MEDFFKFIGTGILRRDLFDIGVPRHVLYFFKWILNQGRKEKKKKERERERMMKSGLIRESFGGVYTPRRDSRTSHRSRTRYPSVPFHTKIFMLKSDRAG